jgi:hypothetical protein
VAGGEGAGLWSERQRLLLRATDELHADRRIDPATAARLAGVLSERQLVELCLLVGHYEMLAMVLKTRGTEPEPGAIRHLDPRTAAIGETLSTVISGPEADTAGRPTLVTPGGSDLRL